MRQNHEGKTIGGVVKGMPLREPIIDMRVRIGVMG